MSASTPRAVNALASPASVAMLGSNLGDHREEVRRAVGGVQLCEEAGGCVTSRRQPGVSRVTSQEDLSDAPHYGALGHSQRRCYC